MVVVHTDHQAAQPAQQMLAAQVLRPLLASRRPERILVLKHADVGDLALELVSPAVVVRLSTQVSSAAAPVRCRIEALPFEDAAFDFVIVHHLLSDGSEAFVAEALRVLAAGGDMILSGLNSSGLRNRIGNKQQLPALQLTKVCNFLKSNSFMIKNCLLMGMAGMSRPAPRATWYGLGLPFADRVVLHGHHQSNIQNANILRFKQIRTGRARSAALDGVSSREAAS